MSKKENLLTIETMHGTFYTCNFTPTYLKRKKWEPVNPKHVVSFIPSTITEVVVKVGEKVKEGDVLLRFKAMKMDNTIESDCDGVIKTIHVQPGDSAPKGILMLEFE